MNKITERIINDRMDEIQLLFFKDLKDDQCVEFRDLVMDVYYRGLADGISHYIKVIEKVIEMNK